MSTVHHIATEARLGVLAIIDVLRGMPEHRYFAEMIALEFERAFVAVLDRPTVHSLRRLKRTWERFEPGVTRLAGRI